MTLKTFHFAGVAGMSITQGVPRIKEIINASKEISTPVITCELVHKEDVRVAQIVKGRIEKTFIRDIICYIEEDWNGSEAYINIKVDFFTIQNLQLELSLQDILRMIKKDRWFKSSDLKFRSFGSHIHIFIDQNATKVSLTKTEETATGSDPYIRLKHLMRHLPTIRVLGYPQASRAIIRMDETNTNNTLLVEGYGLRACMTTDG